MTTNTLFKKQELCEYQQDNQNSCSTKNIQTQIRKKRDQEYRQNDSSFKINQEIEPSPSYNDLEKNNELSNKNANSLLNLRLKANPLSERLNRQTSMLIKKSIASVEASEKFTVPFEVWFGPKLFKKFIINYIIIYHQINFK